MAMECERGQFAPCYVRAMDLLQQGFSPHSPFLERQVRFSNDKDFPSQKTIMPLEMGLRIEVVNCVLGHQVLSLYQVYSRVMNAFSPFAPNPTLSEKNRF